MSNVNEKVSIFSKSVLNVLSNFIPQETILYDDKHPHDLILVLSLLYRPKRKFSKIIEKTKPIFNCLIN